jgi:hypothetical protein
MAFLRQPLPLEATTARCVSKHRATFLGRSKWWGGEITQRLCAEFDQDVRVELPQGVFPKILPNELKVIKSDFS